MIKKIRLWISRYKLNRAINKRIKAAKWRIWVQSNPHVHVLNYPYYRLKAMFSSGSDEQ